MHKANERAGDRGEQVVRRTLAGIPTDSKRGALWEETLESMAGQQHAM